MAWPLKAAEEGSKGVLGGGSQVRHVRVDAMEGLTGLGDLVPDELHPLLKSLDPLLQRLDSPRDGKRFAAQILVHDAEALVDASASPWAVDLAS